MQRHAMPILAKCGRVQRANRSRAARLLCDVSLETCGGVRLVTKSGPTPESRDSTLNCERAAADIAALDSTHLALPSRLFDHHDSN